MAIKQIQLRGISRTPSDRMTADGGCAESINVHIEGDEIAPTLFPKQVKGLNCGLTKELVYIHKTSYENYIYLDDGTKFYQNDNTNSFLTIDGNETFKEIQAIGNTLMVLTDKRMFYVLYKDGGYKLLGEKIPEPRIIVKRGDASEECVKGIKEIKTADDISENDMAEVHKKFNFYMQSETRTAQEVRADENQPAYLDEFVGTVRTAIGKAIEANLANNALSQPIFLRYAVRLYDGSYVRHSAPILIENVDKYFNGAYDTIKFRITQTYNVSEFTSHSTRLWADNIFNPYKVLFQPIDMSMYEGWEDIVSGIEVFASTPIVNTDFEFKESKRTYTDWNNTYNGSVALNATVEFHWNYFDIESEQGLLSYANFYSIKKWNIDEYKNITTEQGIDDYTKTFGDELVFEKRLSDDMFTNDMHIASSITTYNNRLILSDIKTKLYEGYYSLPSTLEATEAVYDMYIVFEIRNSDGTVSTVKRGYFVGDTTNKTMLAQWLYYPNPRCFRATVYLKGESYPSFEPIVVDMKEHPNLNGAYAYSTSLAYTPGSHTVPDDNPYTTHHNRVYQSIVNNPFAFPIEKSFPGRMIAISPVTHAISTGQFGYASLYAFTSEGIWTISTAADGEFSKYDYLSADVALDGTVCPIEQAIVFSTSKAVMMLQGSEIINLSPNMNGKPYVLAENVRSILEGTSWDRPSQFNDGVIFMNYMADARPLYDYRGQRIIFFNGSSDYAYTYYLNAATWHKIAMNTDVKFSRVLGNYPDAWISAKSGGYIVYDYSTNLSEIEDEETDPNAAPGSFDIKGMIITRTFDLDAPDVRKVIKSIRVRGVKNPEDENIPENVMYILLGSMDGLQFGVVNSLRKASFKFYRLILLLSLQPTERISWVDIDYEPRYTKRLR